MWRHHIYIHHPQTLSHPQQRQLIPAFNYNDQLPHWAHLSRQDRGQDMQLYAKQTLLYNNNDYVGVSYKSKCQINVRSTTWSNLVCVETLAYSWDGYR
jgi:hypothetical protein